MSCFIPTLTVRHNYPSYEKSTLNQNQNTSPVGSLRNEKIAPGKKTYPRTKK